MITPELDRLFKVTILPFIIIIISLVLTYSFPHLSFPTLFSGIVISIVLIIGNVYLYFVRGISRMKATSPSSTPIDNALYHDLGDEGWWSHNGPVSGLHKMNKVRVSFFDRNLRRHLNVDPQDSSTEAPPVWILDIGCGGGILTEEMARQGYHLTGIDVSHQSLQVARDHSKKSGLSDRIQYQSGSATELPFPNDCVDGIVISDVLEHIHDLPKAISEMARVLRPGGVLVFDTMNRTLISYFISILTVQEVFQWVPRDTHNWDMFVTPKEVQQLMAKNDLILCDVAGISPQISIKSILQSLITKSVQMNFTQTNDLSNSYMGCAVKSLPHKY
eukprot:gb/GECH01004572.1/.p1 GENE.gb/GECH01004572.1/~~gb/GECH01004572.1/.p1  ORF type:complete len:332 (+),score=48.40 gb/GECH01004572.1/:1-996(+)